MKKLTLGIMALMMSVACLGAETVKIGDIWYKLYSDDYTAIYTNPANPVQKLIREGKVYILRDEKTYTIQGQIVK